MAAPSTALLNRNTPFFDWYLMPEAFSAPLINDAITEFGVPPGATVLDPFGGTGTTLVASRHARRNAVGIEVNPFLCWAARVKTHPGFDLPLLRVEIEHLLGEARGIEGQKDLPEMPPPYSLPAMPRMERWIARPVALKVMWLRAAINELFSPSNRDVPLLALASVIRGASNMKLSPHAFGSREAKDDAPVVPELEARLRKMVTDIEWLEQQRGLGRVSVVEADVRSAAGLQLDLLPASLAITSPPYLNNLDYTMQTRMELFFLGFVASMAELRQLRKRMMICDAKATYRDIDDWQRVEELPSIREIAAAIDERLGHRGWGWDYGRMTRQYFGGLLRAIEAVGGLLAPGARLVMVLGESAHAGVLVPVPDLAAELGRLAGLEDEGVRVIRTRRSSSHRIALKESAVVLRKPL